MYSKNTMFGLVGLFDNVCLSWEKTLWPRKNYSHFGVLENTPPKRCGNHISEGNVKSFKDYPTNASKRNISEKRFKSKKTFQFAAYV